MSKEISTYIKLQVDGGNATPAGSVGPALGSKGVNIMEFCKQFNARTQDKKGEKLPVIITVYKDKSFDFIIKTPPSASMIFKKSGLQKGSSVPNRNKVGTVTWDDIKEIALLKKPDLNSFSTHSAMRMIAGTARSMGVVVQGVAPWSA